MKEVQEVLGQVAKVVRESDIVPLLAKIFWVTALVGVLFVVAGIFPALTSAAVVASLAVLASA